jgi:hypothetical protein
MLAHALSHLSSELSETEIFGKIQFELVNRYSIDPKLASEMAWDLIEVLAAVDGNLEILEKYFLH